MPWSVSYFPDGAEIVFDGTTSGEEIRLAKEEFFDRRFDEHPPRWVLCDFTGVRTFAVSPADVDRVVTQDRAHVASHPELSEVVVAPRPLEYGMSRMWEAQVDHERRGVYVARSRDEAIGWLHDRGIGSREDRSA